MRTVRGLFQGRDADCGRAAGEVAMRNPSDGGSGERNPEPLAGNGREGQHDVPYVLVGSLIGAILLLILHAIVTLH
jgi:hypothetical protein